ncbi:MAG: hypothetical protein J7K54_04195 [Candidatus Aenigmarchaeota archaeon]|nr:hypothetical protein [Candidatus Aenigmarchaeota archaeon]
MGNGYKCRLFFGTTRDFLERLILPDGSINLNGKYISVGRERFSVERAVSKAATHSSYPVLIEIDPESNLFLEADGDNENHCIAHGMVSEEFYRIKEIRESSPSRSKKMLNRVDRGYTKFYINNNGD